MAEAAFRPAGSWPSDLPMLSTRFVGPDGTNALHRRLHPDFEADRLALEAARHEIACATRLSGLVPQLARIYSSAREPLPWLAREWTARGPLSLRLRAASPPTGAELLGILATVLAALEGIEKAGLAHGDPTPGNILVRDDGSVCLTDVASARRSFAIGRLPQAAGESSSDDYERLAKWIGPLARRSAIVHRDPLSTALSAVFDSNRSGREAGEAAKGLVENHRGQESPLASTASDPLPKRRPPDAVAVTVSVGPVEDQRVGYRLSRRLSLVTGGDAAELRTLLQSDRFVIESVFPEPARSLLQSIQEEGGKGTIAFRAVDSGSASTRPGDAVAGEAEEAGGPSAALPDGSAADAAPDDEYDPSERSMLAQLTNLRASWSDLVEALGVLYLDDPAVDRPWAAGRSIRAMLRLAVGTTVIHAAVAIAVTLVRLLMH